MKNIAVILAGGIGSRVGGNIPKQLLPLADGRSVLEHAVWAFAEEACIDEVCVVMHPDYLPYAEAIQRGCEKLKTIVVGGKERWESSVHAIEAYRAKLSEAEWASSNILLHDAARPFVSPAIIQSVCEALEAHPAVTVAVPATDTIYRVEEGQLREIPDRKTMMRAQTPQAFRLPLIAEAYDRALSDPLLQATDDCGILFKYMPEEPIFVVQGEEANKKITFKEDLR